MTLSRRTALAHLALLAPALAGAAPSTAGPGVQVVDPPFEIPGLARQRRIRVYLPPGHAAGTARYPVIYMHDGQNLFDAATAPFGEWGVDESMDALARSHGFEAIVVGIDHGEAHRVTELNAWSNPRFGAAEGEAYLRFIVDVVKPWVDGRYRTQPGRASTAMMGSSLGALITHAALLRHPQVFGKAGLLSPAYWIAPPVFDETRAHPFEPDTRACLYVGGHEDKDGEAEGDARRMQALLQQRLPARDCVLHFEAAAEHNEAAWRREFPRAVAWLFNLPAPLTS